MILPRAVLMIPFCRKISKERFSVEREIFNTVAISSCFAITIVLSFSTANSKIYWKTPRVVAVNVWRFAT